MITTTDSKLSVVTGSPTINTDRISIKTSLKRGRAPYRRNYFPSRGYIYRPSIYSALYMALMLVIPFSMSSIRSACGLTTDAFWREDNV